MRVIENDVNRGKGYSVRRGFAEARGDRLVFIDADLSLPIEGLDAMMARFDAGADVVIASRTAPGSRVEGAPPAMRDVMSRVFNLAVQAVALPGIVGHAVRIQGLHGRTPRQKIFRAAESDRFGFDVEALYLARKNGFRIDELPVICRYHGGSSVNRVSDGVRMFADILAIRRRHRSRTIPSNFRIPTTSSAPDSYRAPESCAADRDARSDNPRGRRCPPSRAACPPG